MANKILLPNGCSMGTPSVNPPDWESGGQTLLKKDWRIQYYFYDPNHPKKRKLVVVKNMNEYKDLHQRRTITKAIIEDEIEQNKCGYNPILGKYTAVEDDDNILLNEHLPFVKAFRLAHTKIEGSKDYLYQIDCAINRIEKSAKKLRLSSTTIGDLRRKQLKLILENCNLPNNYFNKFLKYVSRIFVELIENECCETNLVRDIKNKKTVKKKREVLSVSELKIVLEYLKKNYYEFWRYTMIFLHSGGRTSEFFSLQVKNIDIKNQEYTILLKKGQQYIEETKVILNDVVYLWEEAMTGAKQNDYLFSKGLKPGPNQIDPNQITKRWYRLVKNSKKIKDSEGNILKITADFYALKHLFLDILDIETARKIALHTNTRTTSIYQVNKEKRDREELKKIQVKFINYEST